MKVPDDSVEEDKSGSFALYTMTVMTFLRSKNIIILKPWTSSNGQLSWLRTMPKAPSITMRNDVENRFDKLYQEIKQKYKPRN